jgi:hypothetical protein
MKCRIALLLVVLMATFATVATSCPVCYGQTDSNAASAVNASVIALLIVTGAVLSMFGSFILFLRKRMRLVQNTAPTNSAQIERK